MATSQQVYDYLVKTLGGGDQAVAKQKIDALSPEAKNALTTRVEGLVGKKFTPNAAAPAAPAAPVPTAPTAPVAPAPVAPAAPATVAPAAPAAPVAPAPPAVPTSSGTPTAPGDVSATPRGSVARDNLNAPDQRASEIDGNLKEGLKNAPDKFATRDAFYKAYDYASKPENERRQLDDFYNKNVKPQDATPTAPTGAMGTPKMPTVSDGVRTLLSGGTLDNAFADTKDGKAAQYVASNINGILGATDDQLTSMFRNGTLNSDMDLAKIEAYSPEAANKLRAAREAAKKANAIDVTNSSGNALISAISGTGSTTPDAMTTLLEQLSKSLLDTSGSTETEAEKNLKGELASDNEAIKKLQLERDKIYDDLAKTSTGVPKSLLMAMAAQKAKPLNDELNTKLLEYQTKTAKFNSLVEERKATMDAKTQLAERQLKVYQLYTDHQERLAKAASSKNANSVIDTLPINGVAHKVLVDKNTGEVIKDFGVDIEKNANRFQLTDYMGMKMAYDPITAKMFPVDADMKGNPEMEQKLQKEYRADKLVQGHDTIKAAYLRTKSIAEKIAQGKSTGIDDVTLLYNMIKGLDPTSVVRESEVALMDQANSLLGRIQRLSENVISGRVLSNTVAKQIGLAMEEFYNISRNEVAQIQSGYIRRGSDVMARPDRIIDGDIYAPYDAASFGNYMSGESDFEKYMNYLK